MTRSGLVTPLYCFYCSAHNQSPISITIQYLLLIMIFKLIHRINKLVWSWEEVKVWLGKRTRKLCMNNIIFLFVHGYLLMIILETGVFQAIIKFAFNRFFQSQVTLILFHFSFIFFAFLNSNFLFSILGLRHSHPRTRQLNLRHRRIPNQRTSQISSQQHHQPIYREK